VNTGEELEHIWVGESLYASPCIHANPCRRAAQEEITKVGVDIITIRLNVLPGQIEGDSFDWVDTYCVRLSHQRF
jgi:hypothetical protein